MLKYSINSPRLGTIAAFRFKGDLQSYLAGCEDSADDWQIQVFGNTVGTVASMKTLSQSDFEAALEG